MREPGRRVMDFFPAQRPGSSLCPRDAQSVHGDRLEVPISVGRRPLHPPALQRLLGAAPGRDWPPDQGRHRPGPRQRQRGGRARRPSVEPRDGGGAKRRRSSHTPSVKLVETTAPPHRRLDPLAPIRAFALRVERLATSQHVDVLLDPPGSGLRPLGGTETVQHGKAVLAGEILEHRLRLRPRG